MFLIIMSHGFGSEKRLAVRYLYLLYIDHVNDCWWHALSLLCMKVFAFKNKQFKKTYNKLM